MDRCKVSLFQVSFANSRQGGGEDWRPPTLSFCHFFRAKGRVWLIVTVTSKKSWKERHLKPTLHLAATGRANSRKSEFDWHLPLFVTKSRRRQVKLKQIRSWIVVGRTKSSHSLGSSHSLNSAFSEAKWIMEEKCTLSKKVGGVCGLDKRYKETNVVPLLSCKRNVTEHTRVVGITGDIDTESELILARASIFVSPSDISTWQICPAHRSRLGIGWRRGANRCRVPAVMSSHGERKRIADRGIWVQENTAILRSISSCWLWYVYCTFYMAKLLCPQVIITLEDPKWIEPSAIRVPCMLVYRAWEDRRVLKCFSGILFYQFDRAPTLALKKGVVI